ncbi:Type 1 glutamine amidotransferase-like domain-containing protein [Myxococcota bacterium]|nr:Type 1 glutamine amidotransferase-like domain-containing protein [Myxococcota bacterium]
MPGRIVLLGPQHPEPNLPAMLDRAGVRGPLAVVSAGWRYDEGHLGPLAAAVKRPLVHLPLYRWFDDLSQHEPGLAEEWHRRQQRIAALKRAYQIELRGVAHVLEELESRAIHDKGIQAEEIAYARAAVRTLDKRVLQRLDEVRAAFPRSLRPWELPEVAALHDKARAWLADCEGMLVAGGHVAILLNRMVFFGLDDLSRELLERGGLVAAWSGGAMVCSERIVLFYDDPPEGSGDPEILDRGLGLFRGLALFPHAGRRLRLEDADRVHRLATRLHPARCLTLDNGACVEVHATADGCELVDLGTPGSARELGTDGSVTALPAAGGAR